MSDKPNHLEARVGEYRPFGERYIRITAEGCVMDQDMRMLLNAKPHEREVFVCWGNKVKTKAFTRLKVGKKSFLADRITGTLYNEATGLASTYSLRLV